MTGIAGKVRFSDKPIDHDDAHRLTRFLTLRTEVSVKSANGYQSWFATIGTEPEPPSLGWGNRGLIAADAIVKNRKDLILTLSLPADSSDQAVVCAAVERWGSRATARLRGRFAIAAWDGETLTLVRDAMGANSLFYAVGSESVSFCTLPTALAGDSPTVCAEALATMLMRCDLSDEHCLFEGVKQVPAGGIVRIGRDQVTVERWYCPPFDTPPPTGTYDDWVERLLQEMEAATAYLVPANGLGVFMSGGLDSTTVAALALRHLPEETELPVFFSSPTDEALQECVSGPNRHDEGRVAEFIAMHPGAKLYTVNHVNGHYSDGLADLGRIQGMPLIWADAYFRWFDLVCAAYRQGCTRVLEGSAGNLFASWRGHERLRELFRGGAPLAAWREARALAGKSGAFGAFKRLAYEASPARLSNAVRGYGMRRRTGVTVADYKRPFMPARQEWLRKTLGRRLDEETLSAFWEGQSTARRWRLFNNRMRHTSGAMSAAIRAMYGIEIHDPFADPGLAAFTFSLPMNAFLEDGKDRRIMRDACRSLVPQSIVDHQFSTLQALGGVAKLAEDREALQYDRDLIQNSALCREAFDLERIDALIDKLPTKPRPYHPDDYHLRLGLAPALAAGSFVAWVEKGMPFNGVSQHRMTR